MAGGFHPGERAVQRRAGVVERADAIGPPARAIPPVGADFLAEQQWLVVGAADATGRLWATVLYGPAGFLHAVDERPVRVRSSAVPGDPLAEALQGPLAVGALAIEPATRRRMRLNGHAEPFAGDLVLTVDEVYSNCPKYIAGRSVVSVVPSPAAPSRLASTTLGPSARTLLAAADTAFVATRAPGHGTDASHRGGQPGFLHVTDEGTVVWPDYQGNSLFNTLGNLELDPGCGLTVVDPRDGTTLHVSGQASVIWDAERIAHFPSAQRLVELRVEAVVELAGAGPLRWRLERPARNPPAPMAA